MSDYPYTTTTETCHACSAQRCEETFVCSSCGIRYNSCHYRIGGHDGHPRWPSLCSPCWEEKELGWDPQTRRSNFYHR